MDQVDIQARLKTLGDVLADLEKEAKAAVAYAVDTIAAVELAEVRRRIQAL